MLKLGGMSEALERAQAPKAKGPVRKQLLLAIADEQEAIRKYNKGLQVAEKHEDEGTEHVIEHITGEEKRHIVELRARLRELAGKGKR